MAAIRVTVGLHGELRALHPDRAQQETMSLAAGATVADALAQLGHGSEAWLAGVNGQAAERGQRLADGDRLDLYPFIEGG